MSSYQAEAGKIKRHPSWVAVVDLDQCENTFGTAPCAATGTPCYYSWTTCKDQGHYALGTKSYQFCMNQGRLISRCLPYLKERLEWTSKLSPDEHITRLGEIHLVLLDDLPAVFANADKSVSNTETAGTFWRNLLARNPNFRGREVRLYEGFAELTFPDDYLLRFRGILTDANVKDGQVELVVKDYLKKLDQKVPARQSSGSKLTALYNGATHLYVSNADQFPKKGSVKIVDENQDEYVSYSGVTITNPDTNDGYLYNCVRGRFGTATPSHAKDCEVHSIAAFADPDTGEGIAPDRAAVSLLCEYGQVPADIMAVADPKLFLAGNMGVADNPTLQDASELPAAGVLRIEDELIWFDSQTQAHSYGTVDSETGPANSGHILETALTDKRWHFIKFTAGAGVTSVDRVTLNLKRVNYPAGMLFLSLYADSAGSPGALVGDIYNPPGGQGKFGYLNDDLRWLQTGYKDHAWNCHVPITPGNYWIGFYFVNAPGVITGSPRTGTILQSLRSGVATTEFKHAVSPTSTMTGIAGYPLFKVESLSAGTFDTLTSVRGAFGTDAATHAAGTQIYLLEVSQEADNWLPGCLYRRILDAPKSVNDLMREFRQATMAAVWQGEDCQVHVRFAPVPIFSGNVKAVDDAVNVINKTESVSYNEENRLTRVTLHYGAAVTENDPGTDTKNYPLAYLAYDDKAEAVQYYGEKMNREFWLPWIYRDKEVRLVASHLITRFRKGAWILNFSLEMVDAVDLKVGDFVIFTSRKLLLPTGEPLTAIFEITGKDAKGAARYDYAGLIVAGAGQRYAVIGTSDMDVPVGSAAYDDFSPEVQAQFGFISDANNQVGAAGDPGYNIS